MLDPKNPQITPPFSKRTRRIYFLICACAFVLLIPAFILYGSGYRLGSDWKVTETGGIYIYSSEPGAALSLGGKEISEGLGLFQRGFFVQDLVPSPYDVVVFKPGFTTWEKKLQVRPKLVTEATAFLVPQSLGLTLLSASTTDDALNTDFNQAVSSFSDAPDVPSLPEDRLRKGFVLHRDVALWIDGNKIIAEWRGAPEEIPSFFCSVQGTCQPQLVVREEKKAISDVNFYPGRNDAIIYAVDDSLFAAELDQRPPQTVLPLFRGGKNVSFRVRNGENVYLRSEGALFKLEI